MKDYCFNKHFFGKKKESKRRSHYMTSKKFHSFGEYNDLKNCGVEKTESNDSEENEELSISNPLSSKNLVEATSNDYEDKSGLIQLSTILEELQKKSPPTRHKPIELDIHGVVYTLGRCLGRGQWGNVYIATNSLDSDTIAVKRVEFIPSRITRVRMEVDILKKVKHEHIVGFFDVKEKANYLYIAMEYLAGGELFDYVLGDPDKDMPGLQEIEAAFIMTQVLSAISYLHSHNIVHRDIKLENVLLTEKGRFPIIKLADFGLSKIIDNKTLKRHSSCGSIEYTSPEVLSEKPYGQKSDMWSFGVMAFCMVSGFMPFFEKCFGKLFDKITAGFYSWEDNLEISKECKSFVDSFLRVDPEKRPTAEESVKNEWLIFSSHKAEKIKK